MEAAMSRFLLAVMLPVLLFGCGGEPEVPPGREDLSLADYAGDWSGTLSLGGNELPLAMHVIPGAEPAVTLDSPSQGAFGIPATEHEMQDGALYASWGSIGARYLGRLSDEDTIVGEFAQGPMTVELVFRPAVQGERDAPVAAAPGRPQEPGPDRPYREEEVTLTVSDGVSLGGTLTLPEGEGPFPAVVLLTGSGAQDRDESLLGHKPFLVLSDRLTKAGIATLRFDDRGMGASGGSLGDVGLTRLAEDAGTMLDYLMGRSEVGAAGLLGHSEGGIVAGMVPSLSGRSEEPAFLVSLAGPFAPMEEIINHQVEAGLRRAGKSEEEVAETMALQRSLLEASAGAETPEAACDAVMAVAEPQGVSAEAQPLCTPLMHSYFRVDPAAGYAAYDGPVLALFGGKDRQVPPSMNLPLAEEALAGNEDAVVKVVEGANHLFQTTKTGYAEEYAQIEETMREDVMATIAEFVSLAASN
jgi:pimeloyl-ACP methyl ester carboxylesterase